MKYLTKYKDKIYHFYVCFSITCILSYISIILATSIALLAGLIKEIYDDRQPNNKFDFYDLIADILGVIMAIFYLLIIV